MKKIKQLMVLGCLILLMLLPLSLFAFPRAYGKVGNSAASNATIEVPFNPRFVRVCNEGATNAFMIDFTDGVATTTDNSTNIKINPGTTELGPHCVTFEFEDKNVTNEFDIGIIQISGASAYNIMAWR